MPFKLHLEDTKVFKFFKVVDLEKLGRNVVDLLCLAGKKQTVDYEIRVVGQNN
jgi:hypothetical protein